MDYNFQAMRQRFWLRSICIACVSLILGLIIIQSAQANASLQIPTGSVPTVTGTAVGAIALILDNEQGFANVRSGPGTRGYDIIGILLPGVEVPALGRTPGGSWIQVVYPGVPSGVGWVFSDLVQVRGNLPILEVPPTATPRTTPTLDPTLAAQYQVDIQPTRLPTFTPAIPPVVPTYVDASNEFVPAGVPMGLVIIGMSALGVLGLLFSFLRSR